MKKKLWYLCITTIALSSFQAQGRFEPSIKNSLKTAFSCALLLSAVDLYTKKSLSEEALNQQTPIEEETNSLKIAGRLIRETLIGQRKKETEIASFDLATGKALVTKFPATGVLGTSEEIARKYLVPIATFYTTTSDTVKKIKNGMLSYFSNLWSEERTDH